MKGKDLIIFIVIEVLSIVPGYYIFRYFDSFSDLITFLSIIIGFEISSLAIIFNSPLKKALFDRKNKTYETELHRLKDYYQFSIIVSIVSICLLFCVPELHISIKTFVLTKSILVAPILCGAIYCFYKLSLELFHIFVYPTNEK